MAPNLKPIVSKGGAKFSVAAEHADKFQRLIDALEAEGYAIDPAQSGGYNPRNIAGTNTPSQHSFGNAIDINWTRNARGTKGDIDPVLAQRLADELGFEWGGAWKNSDPMHFEIKRTAPVPMEGRGLTSYAGVPSPAPPAPPQSQGAPEMDIAALISQLFGGGQAAPTPAPQTAAAPAGGFGSMAPAAKPAVDPQNALAAQATNFDISAAPLIGGGGQRMPLDLSRLRQVVAQRSRLGTGA
jgi:hypothetical protein